MVSETICIPHLRGESALPWEQAFETHESAATTARIFPSRLGEVRHSTSMPGVFVAGNAASNCRGESIILCSIS
jgi:hypothetical protein